MKKLNCPNCDEIFEVEEIKETVTCPSCKMNFPYQEGINALKRTAKTNTRLGFSYYTRLKFKESNECYEKVLEIEPDNFDVLCKYILNLCYMNTFKDDNFDKIIPLFEKYEINLDSNNTYLFLAFVKDLVQNISVYFYEEDLRVKKDDVFINEIYVLPFFKALNHLKEVFSYLDNVFDLLKENDKNIYLEDNPELMERYNKYKNKVNLALEKQYNLINKGDFIVENETINYLNTNIKEGNEEIRKDERIIVPDEKYAKSMKNLFIFSGIMLVVALILLIVGLVIKNNIITWCSIIPVALALIYFGFTYKKLK